MGHGDICDTGLSLRLGYEGRRLLASDGHRRKDQSVTLDDPRTPETSLTLGPLADEMHRSIPVKNDASMAIEEPRMGRQSSPHSAVSSFSNVYQSSVKKEKDLAVERVSSQISDKDEEGSARKKLRLTKGQSALLEDMFKENSTLNPKQKQALAKQLKLRPRQVEVWFQNRRARTKLKQAEVDCEFLKRCCEKLTDENWRLQKELQELKALKFSPAASLYMQLPSAATLTMCPSCERIGGATDMSYSAGAHSLVMTPKPHFFNPFSHSSSAAC